MNIRYFEFINSFLKHSVILSDIVMTLHCFLIVVGVKTFFAEYITGHCLMGAIDLFLASFLLKFCWLYRSFVLHNLVVYTCIVYEREIGFGILLTPIRYFLLISGIFLILLLFKRKLNDECDKGTNGDRKPHRTNRTQNQGREMRPD